MQPNLLTLDFHNPQIAILTLNRPEKRNALNLNLITAILEHLEHLKNNSEVRVVVFKGAGPAFCAGLDLMEATKSDSRELSADLLCKLFIAIDSLPAITIAAVHGAVIAGGGGIMSACDYALAAEGTQFAFPEVKRGLVAAFVAILLRRQISLRAIRELLLFGEPIDDKHALNIGLINRIVSERLLLPECLHMATKACTSYPEAVIATKKLLKTLEMRSLTAELEIALSFHKQARSSASAAEGVANFLKRPTD